MDFLFSAFADEASPNFTAQIAALKRNNYQYIELRNVDGDQLTAVTPKKAREMAAMLSDNGISVWSMGSPIGKMKMDELSLVHRTALKSLKKIMSSKKNPSEMEKMLVDLCDADGDFSNRADIKELVEYIKG